jgi:hypothetical protein
VRLRDLRCYAWPLLCRGLRIEADVAERIAGPARADVVGSATYDVPGTYTWTVPAGTDSAAFDVFGAAGGGMPFSGRPGPQGGHVRATLAVIAGETFTVVVDGRGGNGDGPGADSAGSTAGLRLGY